MNSTQTINQPSEPARAGTRLKNLPDWLKTAIVYALLTIAGIYTTNQVHEWRLANLENRVTHLEQTSATKEDIAAINKNVSELSGKIDSLTLYLLNGKK